jgi:GAF domain-containing protein
MMTYSFLEVATIFFILMGAGVMLFASFWIRNILQISSYNTFLRAWRWLFALTILFLIGYLGSISLILAGQSNYLLIASGMIFFMGALFVYFVGRVSYRTIQENQLTAKSLRTTTAELQTQRSNIEEQLRLRTQDIELRATQLQAVGDVARNISMILHTEDLLPTITNLINLRFGFYHTGIFLIDEAKENALLSAASSEGGKKMINQRYGHRLDESSLVGSATTHKEVRFSNNIQQEADFQTNPYLPETVSEIALPLQVGDRLIGILDIHKNKLADFTEDDLSILSTLASLVAIAIQNARSFDQLSKALDSSEKGYQQVIQRGWLKISRNSSNPGYRYSQKSLAQIKDDTDIVNLKLKAGGNEEIIVAGEDQPATITVPIKFRDLIIGVLNIKSTIDREKWSRDEIAIIRAVADRGGQALENARLLEESQSRASRELVIGEISSRITSSIQVEAILRTAAEELSKTLSGSEVLVQLNPVSSKEIRD